MLWCDSLSGETMSTFIKDQTPPIAICVTRRRWGQTVYKITNLYILFPTPHGGFLYNDLLTPGGG